MNLSARFLLYQPTGFAMNSLGLTGFESVGLTCYVIMGC